MVGDNPCSQRQNNSDPTLFPGSVMIDEPQFLLAPLTNFANDSLSSAVDVSMDGIFYSTNLQPRNDLNTIAQQKFSFDNTLQMPKPLEIGHSILNEPASFNCDVPYNALPLHSGGNTASLRKLDNQNLTTTRQVASKYQPSVRKRAPKAQIMTKGWNSAEFRIRELYVTEGKQVKDVRKIVNKEFGFNAT